MSNTIIKEGKMTNNEDKNFDKLNQNDNISQEENSQKFEKED